MSPEPTLLYLETDDEVTSVIRRLREIEGEHSVLVAPGRSRATSSVVALRLLARVGEEADRRISVVGDALTRSLAAEAGLDAYASVEDARLQAPPPTEAQARRASIRVVRRSRSHDTEPVPAAMPAASVDVTAETETRAVAQSSGRQSPRTRVRSATVPGRRRLSMALAAAGLAALLVTGVALGAVLLPAATVAIVPHSLPLGPVSYEIRIEDPDRVSGTVEATAPVTASGTYLIQAAATGTVVFRNFNTVDVAVGAGTLVAAGRQAFETTADVVAPAGTLTDAGTIQAGEEAAGVTASAVGPNANVAADAIDTILTPDVAGRLRGFSNNAARLVLNPEATAGGVDTTGPEITQQDVDSARTTLVEALNEAMAEALAGTGYEVFADLPEPAQPAIEGAEDLAGTRGRESAEIRGALAYDRLTVERDDVVVRAEELLIADADVVPDGHELLPDATRVTTGEASRHGDALVVSVSLTGASTPAIDRDEVLGRIQGRPAAEASAALEDLGRPSIRLWPVWVGAVPELDWRIDVEVVGGPEHQPQPSASAP